MRPQLSEVVFERHILPHTENFDVCFRRHDILCRGLRRFLTTFLLARGNDFNKWKYISGISVSTRRSNSRARVMRDIRIVSDFSLDLSPAAELRLQNNADLRVTIFMQNTFPLPIQSLGRKWFLHYLPLASAFCFPCSSSGDPFCIRWMHDTQWIHDTQSMHDTQWMRDTQNFRATWRYQRHPEWHDPSSSWTDHFHMTSFVPLEFRWEQPYPWNACNLERTAEDQSAMDSLRRKSISSSGRLFALC